MWAKIASWLMGTVYAWLAGKIPALLSSLYFLVTRYFRAKKKVKEMEESAKKVEEIIEAGEAIPREERKRAIEDALNSAGK